MIFFKPEKLTEASTRFSAVEDNTVCGHCILNISNNVADVIYIEYDKDKPYLVEGLLRAAYNSASLRNIYMGKCSCENIDVFLDNMNFEKTENGYINDIPSILQGSCCK